MLKTTIDTHLGTFHSSVGFSIETGRTTVLLGESGAGKSTILRFLSGLLQPERGHISLNNVTYFDSEQRINLPPQERPFGYVFQDYALFPHLTVFENIAFGLRTQRMAKKQMTQRVSEILEQMHLSELQYRRPAQLSGGQQQRVAIARTLVRRPQLLLLDEPLSALGVQTRREIQQLLRTILTELHMTTVMVTHNYVDALLFGHEILVLEKGQVIQQGDQQDLLERPRSAYIAELVGMNFFCGQVVDTGEEHVCSVHLACDSTDCESNDPLKVQALFEQDTTTHKKPDIDEKACIVVAPGNVLLSTNASDVAENRLRGKIMHILPTGANGVMRVNVMLDRYPTPVNVEITRDAVAGKELHEKQTVYIGFRAADARVYS